MPASRSRSPVRRSLVRLPSALAVLAALALPGCSDDPLPTAAEGPVPLEVPGVAFSLAGDACGQEHSAALLAGQHIHVGEVVVSNDHEHLYVTYALTGGWELRSTKVAVATELAGIPTNVPGNPVPGHFPYQAEHEGATSFTHVVPLEAIGAEAGDELVVAAYADVAHPADGASEGAWGAGERFTPRGNWATHFGYTVQAVTFELSLAVNPAGAGTVTGAGGYEECEEVELTATANEGYVFVNWTDDENNEIGTDANLLYTMLAEDHLLTANFDEEVSGDGQPCPDTPTVTDIDGNVYNTVLIGDRCWMAENLRTTKYHNDDGDPIPTGLFDTEWLATTSGAYAIYPHHHDVHGIESDEELVAAYGKLYNWFAVNDNRGLCPEGWHVPTHAEWGALLAYLEVRGYPNQRIFGGAGSALMSRRQVDSPLGAPWATSEHPRWDFHDTHYGLDVFGFSGLPGGRRSGINGRYTGIGLFGYWWSSTSSSATHARRRTVGGTGSGRAQMLQHEWIKQDGHSVRCLRD